jgi:hypothetical protein
MDDSPDAALDANRRGQLSAEQLRDLRAQVSRRSKGLVGFALHSRDSLAKDVADGHVEAIEGAITKKTYRDLLNDNVPPAYRICVANRQVGNQEFRSGHDLYESAAEARAEMAPRAPPTQPWPRAR